MACRSAATCSPRVGVRALQEDLLQSDDDDDDEDLLDFDTPTEHAMTADASASASSWLDEMDAAVKEFDARVTVDQVAAEVATDAATPRLAKSLGSPNDASSRS